MPSARFAKRSGLLTLLAIAGIFVFWLWPIHFGLTKQNPDAILMSLGKPEDALSSKTGSSSINEPTGVPIHLSPAFRPVSGKIFLFQGSQNIFDLLPPEYFQTAPIKLEPQVVKAIQDISKFQTLETSFEMNAQKKTQKGFLHRYTSGIGSTIEIWNINDFPFWSDSIRQFVKNTRSYRPGLAFRVEQQEENQKPVLQVTAINFGIESFGFLAAEMPIEVATIHPLSRCEGFSRILKVPADHEGFYALRIQSPKYFVFSFSPIAPSINSFSIPMPGPTTSPTPMTIHTALVNPPQPGNEDVLLLEVHPKE